MMNQGYVLVNTKGMFAVCYTRHTHTGYKQIMDFTSDINKASVLNDRERLIWCKLYTEVKPLPVMVHRQVSLVF